jgi:ABC-type transport system substrate-binding protein
VLATSWSNSSGGTVYTFNLRQNVNFSNGDPFNAYQVWGQMYGFYYLSLNSSYWLLDYPVFNMATANFGPPTIALMNQSGLINPSPALMSIMKNPSWPIYVTNSSTIVFHLKAPFPWFIGTLVVFQGLLFDTQWLLKHGGFGTTTAYNPYFNLHPIPGTGPYVVTNAVENSYVSFTQNPNYWGKNLTKAQIQANPYLDPGHVKNVVVNARYDDISRYADLSTGTAQISGILTQDWPLVLSNSNRFSYLSSPPWSMLVVGMALNTLRYPTSITAFRQAIVHAINYSNINSHIFFNGLVPWMGPEYPAWKDYYDLGNYAPYTYNVSLAKQDLTASGVDTTKLAATPLEFRVLAGCTYCIDTAQAVQSDLAIIGIPVNIIVTTPSYYSLPLVAGTGSYSAAAAANNTVSQLTWLGSATFAPGAVTPADSWLAWVNNQTPANNWAIYSNNVVQQCVNIWTATNNTNTIKSTCATAQTQVYNDAPYVWLGTLKLIIGGGSIVWDKSVVSGFIADPVFSGQTETAIFNTVTFVNSP